MNYSTDLACIRERFEEVEGADRLDGDGLDVDPRDTLKGLTGLPSNNPVCNYFVWL